MRLQLLALSALVSSALISSASATMYTSSATFVSNVALGAYFNDFSSVGPGASMALSFAGNGYEYTVNTSAVPNDLYNAPGMISTNYDDEQILITFTGAPVTAVGGNFWSTNIDVQPLPGPIILALSDGTFEMYTSSSASDYRGFTSTTPITSLLINATADAAWPTLDNLTVGTATVVPEPASLSLLGGAVVSLLRRRRA